MLARCIAMTVDLMAFNVVLYQSRSCNVVQKVTIRQFYKADWWVRIHYKDLTMNLNTGRGHYAHQSLHLCCQLMVVYLCSNLYKC